MIVQTKLILLSRLLLSDGVHAQKDIVFTCSGVFTDPYHTSQEQG